METRHAPIGASTPAMQIPMYSPSEEMSEEHVKLLKPVSTSHIAEVARACVGTIEVRSGQQDLAEVVGVSDGRQAAHATLCFVDRAPESSAIDRLQRALVV